MNAHFGRNFPPARGVYSMTDILQQRDNSLGTLCESGDMKSSKTNGKPEAPGCLINGRHFIQRGGQWVEAAVERMPHARRIRVRFDSHEFFELLIKNPKALPYLQGARNMQLALGDTVYEIYE